MDKYYSLRKLLKLSKKELHIVIGVRGRGRTPEPTIVYGEE